MRSKKLERICFCLTFAPVKTTTTRSFTYWHTNPLRNGRTVIINTHFSINNLNTHIHTMRKIKNLSNAEILAMADEIMKRNLSMLNEAAEDTLTATQVAKTFDMTTREFNLTLVELGIQYREGGRWNLAKHLQHCHYTSTRTHVQYTLKGDKKVRTYMTWTMAGLHYLNTKLGYPNL